MSRDDDCGTEDDWSKVFKLLQSSNIDADRLVHCLQHPTSTSDDDDKENNSPIRRDSLSAGGSIVIDHQYASPPPANADEEDPTTSKRRKVAAEPRTAVKSAACKKSDRFECNYPRCEKSLSSLYDLVIHSATHLTVDGGSWCVHKGCSLSFYEPYIMGIHYQDTHCSFDDYTTVSCPECHVRIAEKNGPRFIIRVMVHRFNHRVELYNMDQSMCPLCGDTFSLAGLQRHLVAVHVKGRYCTMENCLAFLKTDNDFCYHLAKHHTDDYRVCCYQKKKVCKSYTFSTVSEYKRHIFAEHAPPAPIYRCLSKDCHKTFGTLESIQQHRAISGHRLVVPQKNYRCGVLNCKYKTDTVLEIQVHLIMHKEIRDACEWEDDAPLQRMIKKYPILELFDIINSKAHDVDTD